MMMRCIPIANFWDLLNTAFQHQHLLQEHGRKERNRYHGVGGRGQGASPGHTHSNSLLMQYVYLQYVCLMHSDSVQTE